MKKLLLNLSIIIIVSLYVIRTTVSAGVVSAAAATPSSQTASNSAQNKAQELLKRVADKVSAITTQNRVSYWGKIKQVGTAAYTITTQDGDKVITTNDATSFYRIKAGTRSDVEFKDLKVGEDIAAIGTVDPSNGTMTAIDVIAKIQRYVYVGQITDVTKGIATITLADNSQVKVDLTDAISYRKVVAGKIISAKLADFQKDATIFVLAYSPDPKTGIYSSLKALMLNR